MPVWLDAAAQLAVRLCEDVITPFVTALDVCPEDLGRDPAKRTPEDLILSLIMNKTTGEPEPPRGALRNQVAVLGAYNSYDGLISPSWAYGYPRVKKRRIIIVRYSEVMALEAKVENKGKLE
jgi:hypothetical protein